MSSATPTFSNLLVFGHRAPLTATARDRLLTRFETVTYLDKAEPTDEQWAAADVIYGPLASKIPSAAHVPKLKFIQLTSAGADHILASPFVKDPASKHIPIASASGVHSTSIPQHFILTTLALFHRLQEQIAATYVEKRWGGRVQLLGDKFGHRELRNQTVGFLGYGQIGRESARLAKAFGANVIAATPSGKKAPQKGFVEPGFGDPNGDLPSAWYSTEDATSFAEFLSKSDVILLSLPSTPATIKILNSATFTHLKPDVVLVNVGRGNAIDTDTLVAALDEGRIAGAALDVTSPEPLPDGHTLYGRNNVIITPHTSGFARDYVDRVIDILIANVDRYKEGKELVNLVDRERGY